MTESGPARGKARYGRICPVSLLVPHPLLLLECGGPEHTCHAISNDLRDTRERETERLTDKRDGARGPAPWTGLACLALNQENQP